ncbi:Neutral alpha-glucosidase AB [Armadillidium nasatum]|uniref:Glucosidase II subunit alpha n=1 Tax=Armadillidium nasatum TaxID=96803 RepID=A0A5N5TBE9_9CRUS|nr:Neutral alpha-glucosidase AB [Armadillidium nasatum]
MDISHKGKVFFVKLLRHRALQDGVSNYEVLVNSLKSSPNFVSVDVINTKNNVVFVLQIYPLEDSTLRVKLNEKNPIYPRFEEPYALLDTIKGTKYEISDSSADGFTLLFGDSRAVIKFKPLKIDAYQGSTHVVSVNSRGLLKFEHYRKKPGESDGAPAEGEENPNKVDERAQDEEETDLDGLWEETFKGHTDTKPRGPSSIGVDINFIGSKQVYGIPEHADSFKLKDTSSGDPYRLYNLDVFEYELDNPMALYGSVPVIISHTSKITAGIFWHNAAETWVDVKYLPDKNVVSSLTGLFSGSENEIPQASTRWISEAGIVDLFIMLGNRPMDVFRQYAKLTGTTNLPPMFSLGYHQSRWNYNDEEDVQQVHDNFDKYNLPLDVIWLDIEHTDGKRYFTWDKHKFPHPIEMTTNLTARGRKLVNIVDPHIKKDSNYFFYQENHDLDYYVKTKDGNEYEEVDGKLVLKVSGGVGLERLVTSILQIIAAREHYINTYSLDRYQGSTLDTFIWNDMNEPSVFNGPEITMQKDNIHPGLGVEHREMHNVNGLLFLIVVSFYCSLKHSATYEGLLRRSNGKLRPFVLTRAHYSGTQRTSAVWTGDNTAEWGHLRISVPMLLSLSVTGITQVGSDVGGFFGSPDDHLLSRWYQAAAYSTFFRAHAHIDTKRREPWLFDVETLNIIREALRDHYRILPYMYTLFYENEVIGAPPIRPLWVEFPSDETTFDIDYEYMLGPSLLVRPIVDEGAVTGSVYFPHGQWYDLKDLSVFTGPSTQTVAAPRDKIPVYVRGGRILPRKDRTRRSSILMREDPYTIYVALDIDGKAEGSLYIDDEHTMEYKSLKFLYLHFNFEGGILSSRIIDPLGRYLSKSWIERVVILGLKNEPSKVTMSSSSGTKTLETAFEKSKTGSGTKLVVRKPGINIGETFTLTLH